VEVGSEGQWTDHRFWEPGKTSSRKLISNKTALKLTGIGTCLNHEFMLSKNLQNTRCCPQSIPIEGAFFSIACHRSTHPFVADCLSAFVGRTSIGSAPENSPEVFPGIFVWAFASFITAVEDRMVVSAVARHLYPYSCLDITLNPCLLFYSVCASVAN